jgi:beta-lactamase regulating signal transducer with metallopeptidase domain
MNSVVQILVAVLNSLWQAAIVAALVWLALKFARRKNLAMNAATRYVVWWAALGVVLVLPAAPGALALWRTRAAHTPSSTAAPKAVQPVLPAANFDAPALITLREQRSTRWPFWVLAIWSVVFLYRLVEIVRSYFYLRGVKRRAAVSLQPLPEKKRSAHLLLSGEVASPMAVGFLRPAVILPETLPDEITGEELHHVLLHEYAHLARRDDWSNLIAHLLGAALALHPAAWWILRQIAREREMACDDWVVARTGSARPYAASLARLSELRWSRRQQAQGEALASGMFGGGSRLGERIELLLARGRVFSPRASLARSVASGAILLALVIAASVTPHWIAFAQQSLLRRGCLSMRWSPRKSQGLEQSAQVFKADARVRGAAQQPCEGPFRAQGVIVPTRNSRKNR